MILLDAVYINDSGGLVLLNYLIRIVQERKLNIFYLLDSRTQDYFSNIEKELNILRDLSFLSPSSHPAKSSS